MNKTTVGGEKLPVQDEEFRVLREDWNEYELASGVRVRVRLTAIRIARVLDGNGQPAFKGEEPHVAIKHQVLVTATGGPSPDATGEAH